MNQPTSTTPRRRLRRGSAIAASFATVLALAGCSSSSRSDESKDTTATTAASADSGGAPIDNALTITTPDMEYDVSGSLRPGVGAITMDNTDDVTHMLAFAQVKDGVTTDQVTAALDKSEEEAGKLFVDSGPEGPAPLGTPALVGPGQRSTVTALDLKPGTYAMICFLTDDQGEPHWKMGMVKEVEISGDTATEKPESDGTITLNDDAITMPDDFNGSGTFLVTNTGKNPHAFSVAKLDAGTSLATFAGAVGQTEQAGKSIDVDGGVLAGGVDALLPGQSAYLTLDLEPGHYGYISPEDMNSPELPPQHGEFDVG